MDVAGVLPPRAGVELRLPLSGAHDPGQVAVQWNGQWLAQGAWDGQALCFSLRQDQVRLAGNVAGLVLAGPGAEGAAWDDLQVWVAPDGNFERMEKELAPLHAG